jgi:hypothetical protein
MSHTIYAAKFEQTIIHQHVHLRRESQSHESAHVLIRLYPIDKSLVVCKAKEGRYVRFNDLIYCGFSNISAISWRPALVVEEAGVHVENHRPWASNG